MKTRLLLTAFIFLLANSIIIAQFKTSFSMDAGGDKDDLLNTVTSLKGSGLFVGGYSESNKSSTKTEDCRGGNDYWVIKFGYRKNGGVIKLWDKTVGGDKEDKLYKVIATKDGGCLLCGHSNSGISGDKTDTSSANGNVWLVRLDKNGKIVWQKTIPEIKYHLDLYTLTETNDGGFVCATSYFITKLNKFGGLEWEAPAEPGHQYFSIQQTSDSGYILTDSYLDGNAITKTDSRGIFQWSKNIWFSTAIINQNVKQTSDGGYTFYGVEVDIDPDGNYFAQYRDLIKTDKDGNEIWRVRDYTPYYYDFTAAVLETADGDFIFSTSVWDYPHGYVYNVEKIDKHGKILWNKNTPQVNDADFLVDLIQVAPDNYALAGYSSIYIDEDNSNFNYNMAIITDTSNVDFAKAAPEKNNFKISNENFKAYPNPVKNILRIESAGNNTFILSDQSGKIWFKKTINGKGQLSISQLPDGVYFLKNINNSKTRKIIIAK
jgi:hypothetical protein